MTHGEAIIAATEEQKRTGKFHTATYRVALAERPFLSPVIAEARAMEVAVRAWIDGRAIGMLCKELEENP